MPAQVELLGPNKLKPIVPVGLKPPEIVAVSLIALPRVTGAEALVVTVGLAAVTATLSLAALHPLDAALFAPSPP